MENFNQIWSGKNMLRKKEKEKEMDSHKHDYVIRSRWKLNQDAI